MLRIKGEFKHLLGYVINVIPNRDVSVVVRIEHVNDDRMVPSDHLELGMSRIAHNVTKVEAEHRLANSLGCCLGQGLVQNSLYRSVPMRVAILVNLLGEVSPVSTLFSTDMIALNRCNNVLHRLDGNSLGRLDWAAFRVDVRKRAVVIHTYELRHVV